MKFMGRVLRAFVEAWADTTVNEVTVVSSSIMHDGWIMGLKSQFKSVLFLTLGQLPLP